MYSRVAARAAWLNGKAVKMAAGTQGEAAQGGETGREGGVKAPLSNRRNRNTRQGSEKAAETQGEAAEAKGGNASRTKRDEWKALAVLNEKEKEMQAKR